jgi:hypothetical protein
MFIHREPEEITEWLVVFYPDSPVWYGRIVPGRFKHVALIGMSGRTKTWVFQEVVFSHARLVLLPDTQPSIELLDDWTFGANVLKFARPDKGHPVVMRGPLTCVSFARHMLGCQCVGVFTPDALYGALLKQGATVVQDHGERRIRRRWRWWGQRHAAIPGAQADA